MPGEWFTFSLCLPASFSGIVIICTRSVKPLVLADMSGSTEAEKAPGPQALSREQRRAAPGRIRPTLVRGTGMAQAEEARSTRGGEARSGRGHLEGEASTGELGGGAENRKWAVCGRGLPARGLHKLLARRAGQTWAPAAEWA